jgi:mRNA-degrading endonuclease toxin of MazEF toxin-antitoxin module
LVINQGDIYPHVVIQNNLFNRSEIKVDKSQLDEYVGTLSTKRMREILNGIRLVLDPRDPE